MKIMAKPRAKIKALAKVPPWVSGPKFMAGSSGLSQLTLSASRGSTVCAEAPGAKTVGSR